MRDLVALCLLVVALHSCSSTVTPSPRAEAFEPFLGRFIADEGFRLHRITYPLSVKLGDKCEGEWEEASWPREKARSEGVAPLTKQELKADGLKQRITRVSSGKVEVFQYQPEADSYLLTYRFELVGGLWFLTYLEDASC
ncbi:MAG TPA: hypothetical protein VEZ11_08415 [Thermoanaerobaculia bacterium]|nr:hypothetical protein [Thermoanaerobaculia bacterium]